MDEVYENIFISDIEAAREVTDVDVIITVCQDSIEENVSCEYYHFELRDGEHNKETFERAVEKLLEKMDEGKTILVHCHRGISRSPSIVATALSIKLDESIYESLSRVKDKRSLATPAPQLWDTMKELGNVPYN